jgi:hypothetical protein
MWSKLTNVFVVAIFGCWLFGFAALIWSASQHPSSERANRQTAHAEQQKTIKAVPQKGAPAQSQAGMANDARSERQRSELEMFFEIKLTDALLVFFTAVLAYKTSGLFVETAGLRDAAEKQRADALRSIAATEIAAKAAERSADALQIIEGAYVYPVIANDNIGDSLIAFRQSEVRTNRLRVNYYFKNFGKTPANLLFFQANLIHSDGRPHLRTALGDALQVVRKTTLGAVDHTEPLATEISDFSREEWGSVVQSATSHLLFTGEIGYADIWGNKWLFSCGWQYSTAKGQFVPDNQVRTKIE